MNGSVNEIQEFYKAYYAITKMINAPENTITYKLKEGNVFECQNALFNILNLSLVRWGAPETVQIMVK